MAQYVEHLVGAQIPDAKALVDRMLGHYFPVQVIHLDKVRVLQCKVLEQPTAFSPTLAQVFERNRTALHPRAEVAVLHRNDEDTVVDHVVKGTSYCLLLVLIDEHGLMS